jgi:hypothetical protein
MPHNNRPFLVQGMHEADDIPGQLEDVVGFDGSGRVVWP